jgi:hypothetical protein
MRREGMAEAVNRLDDLILMVLIADGGADLTDEPGHWNESGTTSAPACC